jgi:MFS family permease
MVGSISDLIGRRYAALLASAFVCIGCIVVGTAHRVDVAIGGSAITGIGSGLAETIGVAGLLELAPAKSRGLYMGCALLADIPFGAALTYGTSFRLRFLSIAQLYSSNTWRWAAWIPLMYVGLNAVLLFIFYRPPPRPNSIGLGKWEIVARIDFIGTLLSISGIALFLLAMQWGGYN